MRGYYRCTHQKLNNCPAKKQVQRLDNDPYTFEVTYRGDHTCMMSSSAPSLPPPPPSEAMSTCSLPASQPLPHLLPMDIKESVGDLYNVMPHGNVSGAGSSPPNNYVDYPRVTDLVDTLFNSDINNNNSINFMFSSEDV
ncbi:putative transcription factor WRKY family [Helianthus annuus]|nr:putative transcription factor WRKY family [Helianthus annuus]